MQVKIAGHLWTIEPKSDNLLGEGFYGTTNHAAQEIHFTQTVKLHMQRHCVLHEILHAIVRSYIGANLEDEETVVAQISEGLFQVFEDNPHLVEWIVPGVTKDGEFEFPS